jgi:hypothetical protein
LELIELAGATPTSAIIDIGGGASRLVDALLSAGYADVTVLDLSEAALAAAQNRIGDMARRVHWLDADVTTWEPSLVWTRGRNMPISLMAERMMCPRCGSRKVSLMFTPPPQAKAAQ